MTFVTYIKTCLAAANESIMIRLSDENDTIGISDWISTDWNNFFMNEYNELNGLIDESELG